MKVISLLQPWATLVVIGAKKIETRSWNTKFRGPILIHASASKKTYCRDLMLDFQQEFSELNLPSYKNLPFGAIIGKVDLKSTVESQFCFFGNEFSTDSTDNITHVITEQELAFGDYSPARYGWLLSDPVSFKDHHYPVKGSLGLWNFEPEICLQCGCTGEDACVHPDFGPCWWEEENLCSHCAMKLKQKIK
ncbi:MAG TPA: ASCH domain-containing protein [Hanamia sp.]|nr:ASCH domain-containing protein [Hanamia sp.]